MRKRMNLFLKLITPFNERNKMETLNKVYLSYRKTVTYEKSGEFLTLFDPEDIKSWLKEKVEDEEYYEIESSIDSVIDEHDRLEWSEIRTSYEQCGFDHQSDPEKHFGVGPFDRSIEMFFDKKKIESLTQQVESLTQKIESSTS